MIDSAVGMRTIVESSPEEWSEAVRRLWEPMKGMYYFIPERLDMATVHLQNFGFRASAPSAQVQDAICVLEEADAWARIERTLYTGLQKLATANPTMTMPDLTVLLVLGDPMNHHFMDEVRALSASGGISGYIVITIWPTEEVLDRLEAIALHELHHNIRYSPGGVVWDPQTVTVGEQIVAEGLADLFAVELCGDRGLTHFVSPQTRADDAVLERVLDGLEVTGMRNFAAWVLGDASARLFGSNPVGLPTGAGYAAGARIVRAYLETTGRTAATAATASLTEILRAALPQLNMTGRYR